MCLSSEGNAEMLFNAAQVFHRFHSDSYLLTVLLDLDRLMYVGNKLFSSSKLCLCPKRKSIKKIYELFGVSGAKEHRHAN